MIAPLAPFASAESARLSADPAPTLFGPGEFVSRSRGWIADAWRDVRAWRHEHGLRVHIAGVGEFCVTADGVAVIGLEPAIVGGALAETLLGPPLVLTLAMQGVWCLHASAVTVDGRAVAFAGESGNGKSTLAASLNDAEGGAWRRLADDTLPVCRGSEAPAALPHFPQLKLPPSEQHPVDAPARLPLAGVFVIAPPDGECAVTVRLLARREAMQALIRHTVAARLFDRPLLAAHLDFCAEAAARVPIWRLGYPHRRETLPQVRDAIRRTLFLSGTDSGRRAVDAGAAT